MVASGLVYYVLSHSTAPPQPQQAETTPVVVATTNIPAYTKVTPGMVEVKQVPATTAPSNAFGQAEQVVGRITQYAIAAGQVLVRGDVVEAGAAQGLTFVIPAGKRAVTVALDEISGVGGFVYPGDRVDILATFDRDGSATTKIILQDIEVLAMNEMTVRPAATQGEKQSESEQEDKGKKREESPSSEKVKSATLAVTPDEAQRLILAAYKGSIHLVLRAREDSSLVADTTPTTDYELMGFPPPSPAPAEAQASAAAPPPPAPTVTPPAVTTGPAAPPAPATPPGRTIEVIRGREHSTVVTDR